MDLENVRREIVDACRWLSDKGLVIGTWGNISVKLDDNRIILTPSRVDYELMRPEDLVVIDFLGNKISGEYNPTSEKHIHRLIYINREDVGAVVHAHSVNATALCAAGEEIPPITEEMSQLIGGGLPITPKYIEAGRHLELAELAVKSLSDKSAVLLRNHGPVCCGKNLKEALVCAQVVEKSATCYIALKGKFSIEEISKESIESERNRYLYSYGNEK